MLKTLTLAVLSFATVMLSGCMGCTAIGPGHVGIIINMAGSNKGVLDAPVKTGWVFYNPFTESVREWPTNAQNVVWTKNKDEGSNTDESFSFTNKDNMVINADVSLIYALAPDKVPAFYVQYKTDDLEQFSNTFLHTTARNCLNDVAGGYPIEKIMGDNQELLTKTQDCIAKALGPYGVIMDPHALGFVSAPRPPEVVIQNINAKIQAEQIALQKQNELLQVQADAAKQVAASEGKAKSMIAEANGEAEANRVRTASINSTILQNKALDNQHDWIWRWNGQMPSTVVSGDGKALITLPKVE